MGPSLQNVTVGDSASPAAALAPVLMAIVFVGVFLAGLLLIGNAEDEFAAFAGWAFAGFGLALGARYFNRLLP